MYTKFNDNTIETKFIKQLVAKTQVPFISTWRPGDFAIRGMMYISNDAIWRCNHTGYPEDLMDTCTLSEHNIKFGKDAAEENEYVKKQGTLNNIHYFTKVSPYIFGKEYYNVTGCYQSNILGYDATTHRYLGLYLRMMRDIFNLDMMPFYNCFCGEYISDLDFNIEGITLKSDSNYKIVSVPVRFGTSYTIAVNSELPVEMLLVVYGDTGLITDATINLNDWANTTTGTGSTFQRYMKTSFQHPFVYRTKDWHQLYNTYTLKSGTNIYESLADDDAILTTENYDQSLGLFEKYLRLLIKLPKTNKSSIVVLEGDYTLDNVFTSDDSNSITWTNESLYGATINNRVVDGSWVRPEIIKNYEAAYVSFETTTTASFNFDEDTGIVNTETLVKPESDTQEVYSNVNDSEILLSPLGLLLISDGNSYAFSNRLIEYLLQNVINPLEQFGNNIKRIQQYSKSVENMLLNGEVYKGTYTSGVWDESLREYLFKLVKDTDKLTTKVDLTGYVDKDTERIITRGLKV